eukprot:scaffold6502_cov184-Skeletonema_dohrnii-CCMP3373.AAC.3
MSRNSSADRIEPLRSLGTRVSQAPVSQLRSKRLFTPGFSLPSWSHTESTTNDEHFNQVFYCGTRRLVASRRLFGCSA